MVHTLSRFSCVLSLTLFCCSLQPSLLSCVQCLLPISANGLNADICSSGLSDLHDQVRVVDRTMCAIGGADRGTNVSCHLCFAKCSWSACACSVLQRSRRAVPSAVPQAEQALSSLHSMTTGERSFGCDRCREESTRGGCDASSQRGVAA